MPVDQARINELQTVLESKRDSLRDFARNGINIDGERVEVKSADATQAKALSQEIKAIEFALGAEQGTKSDDFGFSHAMGANFDQALGGFEAKSLGEAFIQSNEFKSFITSKKGSMDGSFDIEIPNVAEYGTYGQKDIFTGSAPTTTSRGFGKIQRDPMVPRAKRTARVRDLFNVATTNANLIDFFRVMGFAENGGKGNAQTVGEREGVEGTDGRFGLKPQSKLQFSSAQAPVRTIAHWEAAHRTVLADEPQLQSVINNELLYGLALEEDDQILNGDGNNENLLGILNTPGIQAYTQKTGDSKADALRRASTLSMIANLPSTGYVLNPLDWEDIELTKATGDGQYVLVSAVSMGATTQVWRNPVVETPAIAEGTFLSGAFGLGAQLYDRERASVRIAEQHEDFFIRNAIAVLVEERLALAVKNPQAFVKGTFLTV